MRYIDMRISKWTKVKLATLFAVLLPLAALGGRPCGSLQLSATVKSGQLITKLTNGSGQSMKIVGNRVSPVPGFGGFYIELHRADGSMIKYCGMIDNGVPMVQALQSGMSITYRDSVSSITNQYCLEPGVYKARVFYYNSVSPEGVMYSQPVRSNVFQLVIKVGYKENVPERR